MDRGVLDSQVAVHHVEDIHELALVLVYALDLNVIERVERNVDSSVVLDPFLEALFVFTFDVDKLFDKSGVLRVVDEGLEVIKIVDPFVDGANGVADEPRE